MTTTTRTAEATPAPLDATTRSRRSADLVAGACGIAFVLALVIVGGAEGEYPRPGASTVAMRRYLIEHRGLLTGWAIAFVVVCPLAHLFWAQLARRVRTSGDEMSEALGRVSLFTASLSWMTMFIASAIVMLVTWESTSRRVVGDDIIRLSWQTTYVLGAAMICLVGAHAIATGIGLLRSRTLPRWLAVLGLATGTIAFAGGIVGMASPAAAAGALFTLFAGYIWWLAASIALMRHTTP